MNRDEAKALLLQILEQDGWQNVVETLIDYLRDPSNCPDCAPSAATRAEIGEAIEAAMTRHFGERQG